MSQNNSPANLGSIVSITDGARNVIQTYAYDSFGGITPTTNFRNTFTFTGREYDEETGIYFYRARYYDPKLGRFLNVDPIGFDGGDVNLYAYVRNNPVNRTDPEGLASVLEGEGHFVIGGGFLEVTCCTETGTVLRHLYFKVCLGAAIGASGGRGKISNSDGKSCSNPPKRLLGGELGAAYYASVDVGVSVDTGGSGISGSGSLSAGVGAKVKATACYYQLMSSTIAPYCCGK